MMGLTVIKRTKKLLQEDEEDIKAVVADQEDEDDKDDVLADIEAITTLFNHIKELESTRVMNENIAPSQFLGTALFTLANLYQNVA